MALTLTNSSLRPELWRKQLFADVRDNLFMEKFMGSTEQAMIQELEDLKKEAGSNVSFGLGTKLSGDGVTGDGELEGNEEVMTDYDEDLAIDQLRHAVRLKGRMDEKKSAYNMRTSAKARLSDWWAERLDKEILDKLCGKTTSTFSNTPTAAAATRAIYAGAAGAIASVTSTMKMDTKVLDAAKEMAKTASPKIKPMRIGGKEYYVAILHIYDVTALKQDPVYNQSVRDARERGKENPIFTGAISEYNGIIIHEHEYVYRTNDGSASAYVARNVLCGQQAGVFAWGAPVSWVEKSFDYGNSWGISCGAIFGSIKPIFNSVDYGVVTMFTASAAATTA
ncbi:N4-gp56 family major capsid protein [Patescibacteria group bacterium]|uniref:Putative major capsid protein n=1 Tax=viral metagenome TaxID=1070528 RepID=A0A6M3ISV1_9ZZZZ|nr:N4-gp56 family major capsid protein [Patescibacteria group bacterium]